MKIAKADIYRQVNRLPTLKFEEQQLTSFAGLVVFQKLFETCQLKAAVARRLRAFGTAASLWL